MHGANIKKKKKGPHVNVASFNIISNFQH